MSQHSLSTTIETMERTPVYSQTGEDIPVEGVAAITAAPTRAAITAAPKAATTSATTVATTGTSAATTTNLDRREC